MTDDNVSFLHCKQSNRKKQTMNLQWSADAFHAFSLPCMNHLSIRIHVPLLCPIRVHRRCLSVCSLSPFPLLSAAKSRLTPIATQVVYKKDTLGKGVIPVYSSLVHSLLSFPLTSSRRLFGEGRDVTMDKFGERVITGKETRDRDARP